MTGVLPFGSIFIEMYFIFTSFWNYKFYYVYGFMLLVYIILVIVTLCVTTVATYFILNSENWHWMWISFLASGSTSFYVFFYSIYYFFGYMLMFSIGFFMLCGTIGFYGSYVFVKRIY